MLKVLLPSVLENSLSPAAGERSFWNTLQSGSFELYPNEYSYDFSDPSSPSEDDQLDLEGDMDRSSDSSSPTHDGDNASVQSSGSSREGDAGTLKAVKQPRRNKKRYRANFFPRIIKRDLRRLYPKMLSNAINSSDPQLLSAFFSTFARPDCLFTPCDSQKAAAVINPTRAKMPSSDPNSPTFANLRTFLLTFAVQCDLMPDVTFDIRS
eukprot:gene20193-14754_t